MGCSFQSLAKTLLTLRALHGKGYVAIAPLKYTDQLRGLEPGDLLFYIQMKASELFNFVVLASFYFSGNFSRLTNPYF